MVSSDGPERAAAKTVIVETVERVRWRLWNGKAQDARLGFDQIRGVMHHFRGEPDGRSSIAPSRKLWTALQALNNYLVSQSDWLVNYGERHRAGQRIGTALAEGAANFLVNRRTNNSLRGLVPVAGTPSTGPNPRLVTQPLEVCLLEVIISVSHLPPAEKSSGHATRDENCSRSGDASGPRGRRLVPWQTVSTSTRPISPSS